MSAHTSGMALALLARLSDEWRRAAVDMRPGASILFDELEEAGLAESTRARPFKTSPFCWYVRRTSAGRAQLNLPHPASLTKDNSHG